MIRMVNYAVNDLGQFPSGGRHPSRACVDFMRDVVTNEIEDMRIGGVDKRKLALLQRVSRAAKIRAMTMRAFNVTDEIGGGHWLDALIKHVGHATAKTVDRLYRSNHVECPVCGADFEGT